MFDEERPRCDRRWVGPRPAYEWYVDFWDFSTLRAWPDGSPSYGISDGMLLGAATFDELAAGPFLLHGVELAAEQVDPRDRPNEFGTHFHFLDERVWRRSRNRT